LQIEKKIYIFSKSKFEHYFANYADKFGILAIGATAAAQILFEPSSGVPPIYWLLVLLVMLTLSIIMQLIFRRFARKIIIDIENGKIIFELLRGAGTLEAEINGLETIQLGFYVTFFISGKRIFYNDVINKELVAFLETLKPLKWRRIGKLIYKYW
jgi:hypothetical protein